MATILILTQSEQHIINKIIDIRIDALQVKFDAPRSEFVESVTVNVNEEYKNNLKEINWKSNIWFLHEMRRDALTFLKSVLTEA